MLQEMQWHLAKTRAFVRLEVLFEHRGQLSSSDMMAAR